MSKKKPAFDPNKPYEVVDEKPAYKEEKSAIDYLDAGADMMLEREEQDQNLLSDSILLGAQGASHDFLDEGAGMVEKLTGGDYVQGRDAARSKIDAARERMGIAGDIVETVGNVASTAAIPAGRAGKVGTELALAAAQGAGAAREMEDIPKSVGISTAMSGATQAVGKGASKVLGYDDPNRKLARVAGARGFDFFKKGMEGVRESRKSPDQVAKRLDAIGLFRQGEVIFDPIQGKFVPNPNASRLDTFFKPQTLESLHDRIGTAVSTLKDRNNSLLKGKAVPMDDLTVTLRDAVNDYIPDGYDFATRQKQAEKVISTVLNDLQLQGKIKRFNTGGLAAPGQKSTVGRTNMYVDAPDVEQIKRQLYKEVEASFKQNKVADDLSLGEEAQRKFSAKIDALLDTIGGPEYKKGNDLMSDMLTQQDTIFNKSAREAGYGVEGPRLTMGNQLVNGLKDMTVNNVPVGVGMARLGQLPDTAKGQMIRNFVERLPVEAINNRQQEAPGPYRKPQGVRNIPEELIRVPLPRTTEGLMQKKNFVLAKVAQMMPEMFEAVKDTYEYEPERLGEIAQVLSQKMPHVFERDKYNRFDGRIIAEADKQRAIKDTLGNTQLNSIQRAEIITKLNKEGLYDG